MQYYKNVAFLRGVLSSSNTCVESRVLCKHGEIYWGLPCWNFLGFYLFSLFSYYGQESGLQVTSVMANFLPQQQELHKLIDSLSTDLKGLIDTMRGELMAKIEKVTATCTNQQAH